MRNNFLFIHFAYDCKVIAICCLAGCFISADFSTRSTLLDNFISIAFLQISVADNSVLLDGSHNF